MLFIVIDKSNLEKVLLVKAETSDDVVQRLRLDDTERIFGTITDNELNALSTGKFAVIET